MENRPVRLAVLGSGFGAAVAAPVFAALPGVRLAAVVARRADKAREVAARYGAERAAAGYEALADLDVDAVYIALPPAVSGRAVMLAQHRNLHILAEKPLTADLAELAAIAAWPARRVQMVNYAFPTLPAWQYLAQFLHGEAIGPVRLVTVRWLVHSYAEQHRLHNWKRNRLEGGGILPLLGSHCLHYLEWLFGPIQTIAALAHAPVTEEALPAGFAPANPGMTLSLTTARGVPIAVVLSNAVPCAPRHEIEVIGERATIRLVNSDTDYMREFRCTTTTAGATTTRRFVLAGAGDSRATAFRTMADRFIGAVKQPTTSAARPNFADDVRVQRLLATAQDAARTGQQCQISTASAGGVSSFTLPRAS